MTTDATLNEALHHLTLAVELSPQNVRYRRTLAAAAFAAGDIAGAVRHGTAALSFEPDAPTAWKLAHAQVLAGECDAAIATLQPFLPPGNLFSRGHQVRALARLKKRDSHGAAADVAAAKAIDGEAHFFQTECARLGLVWAGALR